MNVLVGVFIAVMAFLLLMLGLQLTLISKVRRLERQMRRLKER